jgi:uncharacterized damage-inducible protein DinB
MFRTIADFESAWAQEVAATLKILGALDDRSLGQAVAADSRTLGRLAWHVTGTIAEMMNRTGLAVVGRVGEKPVPHHAAEIVAAYEESSRSLLVEIRTHWTDASLQAEDDMYGERWRRGTTLMALVLHQAHHRGQMTVLMRQAGLRVPGIYGPAREDWATMGMAIPEI